jgi:phage/plasmid-associated DNA primase
MQIELWTDSSKAALPSSEVASFVRRALGLHFEMRFEGEAEWWPVDAKDVAETLAGYYYNYGMHSCLEQMREGKELPSGLALYRVRR